MPPKSIRPLDDGREMRLYAGDWERLRELAASRGVSASHITRELITQALRAVDRKTPKRFIDVPISVEGSRSEELGGSVQQEPEGPTGR